MTTRKFCDGCQAEITLDIEPNSGTFEIGSELVDLCPKCVPHARALQQQINKYLDQQRATIDGAERAFISDFYERLKANAQTH